LKGDLGSGPPPPVLQSAFLAIRISALIFVLILASLPPLIARFRHLREELLNAELCKRALEKVGNPNVLINLISRRVRQLNTGGGGSSRPLVGNTTSMGAADIALLEIIDDKLGWQALESDTAKAEPPPKKRRKG
jgi:DNA-directed RNA polymerase subunit omega